MKKIIYTFFILLLISCDFIFEPLTYEKSFMRLKKNIEKEFDGNITNLLAPRDDMFRTHFVVNNRDTIHPTNYRVMDFIEIGDYVFKKEFENEISIMKSDSIKKTFWLYKIPKKYRKDDRFPEEWKNKWLDSTVD